MYRYTFTEHQTPKRRKISNEATFKFAQACPQATVTTPAPEISLPVPVLQSGSPQELAYAVLTGEKVVYTKQELLTIIGRLEQMLCPKFSEPCNYIS